MELQKEQLLANDIHMSHVEAALIIKGTKQDNGTSLGLEVHYLMTFGHMSLRYISYTNKTKQYQIAT